MSSVALIIDGLESVERAAKRIREFGAPRLLEELLDGVGGEIESQTRRRIESEKRAPDGTPWQPWAARTAARRETHNSLLVYEGEMLDSLDWQRRGSEVLVGVNTKYAAIHQFGGRAGRGHAAEIPARPYLGLGQANRDEVRARVEDFLRKELGA